MSRGEWSSACGLMNPCSLDCTNTACIESPTPLVDLQSSPTSDPGSSPMSRPNDLVKSRRKQTLLSLLDALQELTREDEVLSGSGKITHASQAYVSLSMSFA